jgi:predicted phosphodiesterase
LSQLEEARNIKELRLQGTSWNDIGKQLNRNGEACRSILRRYESEITGEVSVLSILDKKIDLDGLIFNKKTQKLMQIFDEQEQKSNYGDYFYVSDLHGLFCIMEGLKVGILDAKSKKITKAIINGDLFDLDSASKFMVPRDSIIASELPKIKDILTVFGKEFEATYITAGNHDDRVRRLLFSKVPNGIKDLIQGVDPIQKVIDDLKTEEGIENLYYTWGNELKLGNVIFAHPEHFSSVPGRTVLDMIDTYLLKHKDLSAVIIGHTHADIKKVYKGVYAFETGCLCFEPDYRLGARKRKDIWTVAYSIFRIKEDGNLDYKNSHVIPI